MRISYYSDTDPLYIDLSAKPSAESREISPGVVIDYDAEGNIVGIDIDQASRKLDLDESTFSKLPAHPSLGTTPSRPRSRRAGSSGSAMRRS